MTQPLDLTLLNDEDLATLRSDVNAEVVRRARISAIPAQIKDMAREYVAAGGNVVDLVIDDPAAEGE